MAGTGSRPGPWRRVRSPKAANIPGQRPHSLATKEWESTSTGRNRRSVWTVATAPYSEAHFATYPPKLIEPCILAGTSERGCCSACGSPWERAVERKTLGIGFNDHEHDAAQGMMQRGFGQDRKMNGATLAKFRADNPSQTTWQPTCDCSADVIACTVLDPFGGSGTTAGVANALGRDAILCELSPDYAALIPARVKSIVDSYFGREHPKSVKSGIGQRELF